MISSKGAITFLSLSFLVSCSTFQNQKTNRFPGSDKTDTPECLDRENSRKKVCIGEEVMSYSNLHTPGIIVKFKGTLVAIIRYPDGSERQLWLSDINTKLQESCTLDQMKHTVCINDLVYTREEQNNVHDKKIVNNSAVKKAKVISLWEDENFLIRGILTGKELFSRRLFLINKEMCVKVENNHQLCPGDEYENAQGKRVQILSYESGYKFSFAYHPKAQIDVYGQAFAIQIEGEKWQRIVSGQDIALQYQKVSEIPVSIKKAYTYTYVVNEKPKKAELERTGKAEMISFIKDHNVFECKKQFVSSSAKLKDESIVTTNCNFKFLKGRKSINPDVILGDDLWIKEDNFVSATCDVETSFTCTND